MKVKVAQLCPTLCDPTDYTVHGILQARILEWVAFPFSRGSSQPRDRTQVSRIVDRSFTMWATRAGDPGSIPGSGRSAGEGISRLLQYSWASLVVAQLVKNLPAMWETWVWSLGWEDPLEKEGLPTPVFWPGEFHGLYNPWGCKESDTTEWLSFSSY